MIVEVYKVDTDQVFRDYGKIFIYIFVVQLQTESLRKHADGHVAVLSR